MQKLRAVDPAQMSLDDFHALITDTFDTVCQSKVDTEHAEMYLQFVIEIALQVWRWGWGRKGRNR